MKRIVLGLVGYSGAGKGTVARYLSDRKSFSEVRLLKTYLPGLILLAVKTDIKKRFQRLIKRKRPLDPTTFAEFIASEKIEKGNSKDKTAPQQQNQACVEMADREIKNNGKIENLFRQLDAFLLMIGV